MKTAGARRAFTHRVERPPRKERIMDGKQWVRIVSIKINQGDCMANTPNEWEETLREITSKRRKGYPSETRVKRGRRVVHGNKELFEKLGRNDPCPCGSGLSFQEVLPEIRPS
jgi:hypothetical protein